MLDRTTCVIELDSDLNVDQLHDELVRRGYFGCLSASEDGSGGYMLRFTSLANSYQAVFDEIHALARELASPNTEWIVKVWEAGSK